jgi:murein DD-endopeptidase MepM/ murein hydrolase activator NlpD
VTQRVAVIGGAAAFVVVALMSAFSASPAARATAAPAPVQQLLAPQALVPPQAKPGEDPDYIRVSANVGPDLTRSLQTENVPDRIGREYVGLLARAIPLAEGLSVEDKFDLVYERGDNGRLVYAGLDRIARADVELLKWTDGHSVIWVNGDGVGGDGSQGMLRPVAGRVTSGFGERFHPILGYERMHAGVDLAAAYGSPIAAAADGRVLSAGWRGGYGRAVLIQHAGGVQTMYGHMSRIAAAAGSMVRRGQVIGYVGASGLATGPHLHYEVLKGGRAVNPFSVRTVAGGPAQLDGAKLHAFNAALRRLLTIQARG